MKTDPRSRVLSLLASASTGLFRAAIAKRLAITNGEAIGADVVAALGLASVGYVAAHDDDERTAACRAHDDNRAHLRGYRGAPQDRRAQQRVGVVVATRRLLLGGRSAQRLDVVRGALATQSLEEPTQNSLKTLRFILLLGKEG